MLNEFLNTTNINILVFMSVLPGILLLLWIYRMDRKEPEPPMLLVKLLFGGLIAVVIAMGLEILWDRAITYRVNPNNYFLLVVSMSLSAGVCEEFAKLFVAKRMVWKNKNFDHIFDGIVYVAFVSIGFATIENIMYVTQTGMMTALVRAVLSVPGHMCFSMYGGLCLSLAKEAEKQGHKQWKYLYMIWGFLVCATLHTLFDIGAFMDTIEIFVLLLIFVFILYRRMYKLVKQTSDRDYRF